MNIVMPIAGMGKRFIDAGYTIPKPLIPIHGKEMVRVVIDNLKPERKHTFIFLCLKDHIESHEIDKKLKNWVPGCIVINVDHVTEGAACTVLLSRVYIDNNEPLMIANCDQWVDIDVNDYIEKMETDKADGLIMTMRSVDPNCSFIGRNEKNEVSRVVEKQVISNEATVGIYNFEKGSDFVKYADRMIAKDLRINNEFYVAPVYNEMILDGSKITTFDVGEMDNGMYGFGKPDDLDKFLSIDISKKAAGIF